MRARPAVLIALLIALLLAGGSIYVVVSSDSETGRSTSRFGDGDSSSSLDSGQTVAATRGEGGSRTDRDSSAAFPSTEAEPGSSETDDEEPAEPGPAKYSIEGTVVAADGVGLSAVDVRLYRHRSDEVEGGAFEQLIESLGSPEAGPAEANTPAVGSATTDRFGRFSIGVMVPGEYRLSASSPPLAQGIEGPFRISDRDPNLDLLIVLGGGLGISGFVEDRAGRPIGGAEVSLLDRLEGELPGRHYHAHKAVTASDGSFFFDGLEARPYILTATAAGLARTLLPSVSPPDDTIHVTLGKGGLLEVQVLEGSGGGPPRIGPDGRLTSGPPSGSGEPVPGAKVFALNPVGFAVAVTNEKGIARLSIDGEEASLRILAPGYREGRVARVTISDDPEDGPEVVRIAPITPIEGIVLRSDGEPAPFAELLEVGFGLLGSGLTTLSADGEGRFLYEGSGSLLARLDGEVSRLGDRARVPSDTIELAPTMSVTGRLVRTDGWPSVGSEVRLALRGLAGGGGDALLHWTGVQTSALTGADGVFMFRGIPAWGDRIELVVYAEGSPDLRLPIAADLGDITLGEEAVLTGRLITSDGYPSTAAALILELPGAPPVRRSASGILRGGERVLVAEDGTFFIGRLAPTRPDRPLVIHVVAPPYLEERRTIALAPGENGPLEISLREGGTARVVVENSDGTPRVAAEVQLRRGSSSGGSRTSYTGSDGSASFAGLTPASYQVVVDAGPSVGVGSVDVVAGEISEVVVELEE